MSGRTTSRTLLVGIGSPHGDDQVGWLLVDALRSQALSHVDVRQATIPSDLLDWLGDVDRLIVCDTCAVRADSAAAKKTVQVGDFQRWEWPHPELSGLRSNSSHSFGLAQTLQLAERLGKLPPLVTIFGILGRNFAAFADISPDLSAVLPGIVQHIADEIGHRCPEVACHA